MARFGGLGSKVGQGGVGGIFRWWLEGGSVFGGVKGQKRCFTSILFGGVDSVVGEVT